MREPPPLLFDLTSLQRTANRRFGLSATATLAAAQALYERYKILTYPRTDSRHLTSDMAKELPKLFGALAALPDYAPFAAPLLETPPARSRRVFDDGKVQRPPRHHPDGQARAPRRAAPRRAAHLRSGGAALPRRLPPRRGVRADRGRDPRGCRREAGPRAAAEPRGDDAADADETLVTALPPPPDRYRARGRVRLVAGWQEVAQLGERPAGSAADGDARRRRRRCRRSRRGSAWTASSRSLTKQTRPPPRHTEATLLGAMESAGRDIADEELRAAMRDSGLGTPATRAATIETLIRRTFVARDGKNLVPTEMGIGLIDALPVKSLASPELTGTWEARLARVARGEETRAAFMADISRYVSDVVTAIRGGAGVVRAPGARRAPAAPASRAPRRRQRRAGDPRARSRARAKPAAGGRAARHRRSPARAASRARWWRGSAAGAAPAGARAARS